MNQDMVTLSHWGSAGLAHYHQHPASDRQLMLTPVTMITKQEMFDVAADQLSSNSRCVGQLSTAASCCLVESSGSGRRRVAGDTDTTRGGAPS